MSTGQEAGTRPAEDKPRSIAAIVRHAPRPVWVLVTGVFLNRAGSFFATFLVLFLQQLGFTPREMPAILLAVGVATPLGSLMGGWASDRLSRKTSLVGSTLLASCGLGVIAAAPNKTVALAGVFGAALFAQAYLPAASALLVDHTEERDRVPVFAFFRLALNLGSTVGPLIAAVVAQHSIRPLFLISCCMYALFSLLLAVGLPSVRGAARVRPKSTGTDAGIPPRLVVFYLSIVAITAVYVQYNSTVALSVSEAHGPDAYAYLLTLNGALVILCEMPLSGLTRRVAWWIPALAGTVLMTVGIVLSGGRPALRRRRGRRGDLDRRRDALLARGQQRHGRPVAPRPGRPLPGLPVHGPGGGVRPGPRGRHLPVRHRHPHALAVLRGCGGHWRVADSSRPAGPRGEPGDPPRTPPVPRHRPRHPR
ncbi:hypothetical protein GCM10020295_15960 [Streptomyces cinereospinus]